jgi:aminoglycoside phosphotransferase
MTRLPASAQVSDCSGLERLCAYLAVAEEQDWEPTTLGPNERSSVEDASQLLKQSLNLLERVPAHVTHGDWVISNLMVATAPVRLIGVMDFDQAAHAPVVLDLDQAAASVLIWSNIKNKIALIRAVLNTYEDASGVHVPMPTLQVALVAYLYIKYWRNPEGLSPSTALQDPGVAR